MAALLSGWMVRATRVSRGLSNIRKVRSNRKDKKQRLRRGRSRAGEDTKWRKAFSGREGLQLVAAATPFQR